ncbi:hypothetical protein HFD88_005945 [Aspergillus terreus]|nr:hypothetical protein HFD88_005945 [Aspergillus terreus]
MSDFMSHPLANRTASFDMAGPPSDRDAGVSTFEFDYDPRKGPEHVQDEKTKIEVKKIESDRQQESLHIGISEQEIELLLKTVAADNRLKFGIRRASHKEQNHSSKVKRLEVSYRHPKFVIFLDERSLAITKDCQNRLNQLEQSEDKSQAVAFLEDYGEGFATQVTIGGRLFHSENVTNLEGQALETKESSLQLTAESSLSLTDSSKPSSMHSKTKSLQKDSTKSISASEGLFWCGIGGDPCLHGDPGRWIASLKNTKTTWKIVEKKVLTPLPDVLGRFSGFEWVPAKFEQLLRPAPPPEPVLTLFEESRMGHSSFAIMEKYLEDNVLKEGLVFFQDTAECIKYGYINMRSESPLRDVLFVDTIARARPNTPLASARWTILGEGPLVAQSLE